MRNKKLRNLCECAILIALSLALSYLKIPLGLSFGGFGGSVDLVMIPILILAIRLGTGWGVLSGCVFGSLKYLFANGFAVSWVSILFDYSLAYGAVGLAGLTRKKPVLATAIGCVARFCIHFLSGVTVYAQYMPETFFELTMNVPFYSFLYNATYMLPNTALALILMTVLSKTAPKLLEE